MGGFVQKKIEEARKGYKVSQMRGIDLMVVMARSIIKAVKGRHMACPHVMKRPQLEFLGI